MKLFYVTHSVVSEMTHAIIARDAEHLLEIINDREQEFRQQKFTAKFQKNKNEITGFDLNDDWDSFSRKLPNRGKKAYDLSIANTPRVPTWNELSLADRDHWNKIADQEIQS